MAPHVTRPPPFRRAVSEPTWQRAISVWWLISWRGIIGSAIIGFVAGLAIQLVGSVAGVNEEAIKFTSTVVGTLLGFVWVIIECAQDLSVLCRDHQQWQSR